MPFAEEELRIDLMCRMDEDGHWRGTVALNADARALRRLGLHPDQPASAVDGPSPPAWWHAAGERYARRGRRS
ncbi:hypothetical protein J2Z21_004824 [Streptomyces griseochromogenes]|uniref:Uncharacterized protein n=1 Tax=Streptomyces griseochromogenes TaxID=68214 RepID=A0A1B1AT17_9ACTN|nr:hypothetical protein [Streptomyces griseochromogenes]ANP49687.1 hypothetical protein AVL59_08740 [Streptomyces griseochromogenes]MBP2051847.1 hypothetical protein [Streptomyces griseochromogenes]